MELIAAGLDRARRDGAVARRRRARQLVDEAKARRHAAAGIRPSRALDDRSAGRGAVRARRRLADSPATASASRARSRRRSASASSRSRSTSTARWRRSSIDLGLSADGRQAAVHRRPRRRAERGGARGVHAREADADQDSGQPTTACRRAQNGTVTMAVAVAPTRTITPEEQAIAHDAARARARPRCAPSTPTTRRRSIGCAGRSPGPAATRRPRPGSRR